MPGSNVICTACDREVPVRDINPKAEVARSSHCGTWFEISLSRARTKARNRVEVGRPPPGTELVQTANGIRLSASAGSYWSAVFIILLAAAAFGGSATVSVNLLGDTDSTWLSHLAAFIIMIGSVVLASSMVMSSSGRVEVTSSNDKGRVFDGASLRHRSEEFNWQEIEKVVEGTSSVEDNGGYRSNIELHGPKLISFGAMLSNEQRRYMLQVLQQLHRKRRGRLPARPSLP